MMPRLRFLSHLSKQRLKKSNMKGQKPTWTKSLLSIFVVCLAIYSLFPIQDQPLEPYLRKHVQVDKEEFYRVIDNAKQRVVDGKSRSLFLALKEEANEQKVDLSRYFPSINLSDVKNIKKKNALLLNVLLSRTQSRFKQGLDLKGGVSCIMRVGNSDLNDIGLLDKAVEIIRERVDSLGVAEPVVRKSGNDSIEVQLPGISTQENPDVLDFLKKPARLEFRLVHPTAQPRSLYDVAPIGYELLVMEHEDKNTGAVIETPCFVKKLPEMTGKMIKSAHVGLGNFGDFEVCLNMTSEGANLFKNITSRNINRQLGIVLDGNLYSAPVIRTTIPDGRASITGNFSQREAFELVNVLNNPLECELELVELNEVGPSLASDVRNTSLWAVMISAIAVAAFMLLYYHSAGLVSVLSIAVNLLIILGLMAYLGATMTLPGITALALTIGMAVDSNILIFERIREELKLGSQLKQALNAGYDKAFSTIFDANITTLIAAGILIWFGIGPIRGFGVILAIGIFATMFCALIFSRAVLDFLIDKKIVKKLIPDFHFKHSDFHFLSHAKKACCVSLIVLLSGFAAVIIRGGSIWGIDFVGGDELTLSFKERIAIGDIIEFAKGADFGEVSAVYQHAIGDECDVLKLHTTDGHGRDVYNALLKKYPQSGLKILKESSIGAALGSDIKWNALISVVISLLCIMVYVAFRFEFAYGMGALISILHDVLITIGIYVLCGKQFSAPMVASILMVIGYSINDKIVIFDRIREERRSNPDSNLNKLVDFAINKTLSRTLLTSVSTLLASVVLCIFGIGVIVDLAFVFTVGIIVGTYSSIFIASPAFVKWHTVMDDR